MKYTRYLATAFRTNGIPNLSDHGFATIMNIIHIEGAIQGVKSMQQCEKIDAEKYKYNLWIKDFEMKVDELSLQMEPAKLIEKLAEINEHFG